MEQRRLYRTSQLHYTKIQQNNTVVMDNLIIINGESMRLSWSISERGVRQADQIQNKLVGIIMSAAPSVEEQGFSSEEEDLQCIQLRQKISTKQVEMLHLINQKQKFVSTVIEQINLAKSKIDLNEKQELKFALVYLKESEKILQYAASSGKNINKELIITVLHNQASIYQKLWELNSCSDYLEGIIFNYQNFIRETSIQSSTLSKDPQGIPADPTKIKMKQKLVRYNLQFCAVNSQLGSHDEAIISVGKAHRLMVECIAGCGQQFKRQWSFQGQNLQQIQLKQDLLAGLSNYQKKLELSSDDLSKSILKATHFSLQFWQQSKSKKIQTCQQQQKYLNYLSSYSIGNIVQIVAIHLDKAQIGFMSMKETGNLQFQQQFHSYNRIILLSTCFFSKATELRLKSAQLFKKNMEERKYSRQYKLSISYHLLSIIIVATFIPNNIKYLQEILLSYQKHYGVKLTEYQTVQVESLKKMMELLGIDLTDHLSTKNNTEKCQLELDSKNDYNMKINFQTHKVKKLDKMKSLKRITKELTDPHKKYDLKQTKTPKNKSKQSKNSFSISKYQKKDRTMSRTDKRSFQYRQHHDSKDKFGNQHKAIPKVRSKKHNQMNKSRQREEKKSKTKQYVDETEELFFCFSKKTKKTQGHPGTAGSQVRSSSIASNSGKSKKKSVLSPKNIKMNKVGSPIQTKPAKSPPKRKNVGQHNYYF